MPSRSIVNFVRQQGYPDAAEGSCGASFPGLNFQPRVMGVLILPALLLQWAAPFLALSALLWWSALLPRWNPFDAVYNRLLARPPERPRLTPAPAPRRFSMGMAASFLLGIGVSMLAGWTLASGILQAFLVVALTALVFGRFCMGSYIYYLLTGKGAFANRTLPWARS